MRKQNIIVGSIVLILVIIGVLFFSFSHSNNSALIGAVGDVNQTPRMWQQQLDLSTSTEATIVNPVGSNVLITSVDYYYSGVTTMNANAGGVDSFRVKISTSSDSYIVGLASSYVMDTTIATSSNTLQYEASTSPGITAAASNAGTFARTWSGSSRLNVFANATSSTVSGYVVIRYLKL